LNLILFQQEELDQPLPLSDLRAKHILNVLRREAEEDFDVGLINGPRGKAWWTSRDGEGLQLQFKWGPAPEPLPPITLLMPFARPQTMRKVLQEATAMGLEEFIFFQGAKSEASYRDSSLWSTGEYHRHLRQGTEQAFCTRIPQVQFADKLGDALQLIPAQTNRFCLDNYEATCRLGTEPINASVVLAIGGERGWSAQERDLFRTAGFSLAHLGERVLRTETAVVSSLALVHAGICPRD